MKVINEFFLRIYIIYIDVIGLWFHSVVLRLVHAGGNLNNGAITGVALRNVNNDLGNANANNGSQLSYVTIEQKPQPRPLAKHKNVKKSAGTGLLRTLSLT